MMNFHNSANPFLTPRTVHYATNGMVATSQTLAAAAGEGILRMGGNAVDAAIATAACLTVVEPTSNAIGSDAFAIIWQNGNIYGLNSSGPAPQSISIEAVKNAGYEAIPKYGVIPITVPGAPAAWAALSERFGKLTLAECLQPAINYAENGYPVSPVMGASWKRAYQLYSAEAKGEAFTPWFDTFAPNGRAPEIGEIARLPDHAITLREISRTNAKSLYSGSLADEIAAYCARFGGYLTKDDLQAFKPDWVEPLSVNYRGYDVWELPPNGQGIVALMALNILKDYTFSERDNAETYHKQFESIKLAFAAAKRHVTDPRYMKITPYEMLSDEFTAAMRAKITETANEPELTSPRPGGTVYLAAADGDGNMVSYIQSNYMGFGSGIVIPGTGIALQNRGVDFSLDPSHINCLAGGKKTYHTIIPGFLTKGTQAVGPFGVMGGYMQPQGHLQVIMNSIDFDLNPQAALDAPRWQWVNGKTFMVENQFPQCVVKELELKGHVIKTQQYPLHFGRGQIILRNPESGVLMGGCESRADSAIASF